MHCCILWGTNRQITFSRPSYLEQNGQKKTYGTTEEVDQSDTDFGCLAWKCVQYIVQSVMRRFESARFTERNQPPGEPFEEFLQDLYSLVKTCEYTDENDMLLNTIVQDIYDSKTGKHL